MMKKLFTLLLVLALAVCLGVTAFAEDADLDATPGYWINVFPDGASVDHGTSFSFTAELGGYFYPRTMTSVADYCGVYVEPADQGVTAAITGPTTVTVTVADDSVVGDYTITVWAVATGLDFGANATAEFPLSVSHTLLELQDGIVPDCYNAGYKEYYMCPSCGLCFEDEDGVTPIENLDAWKAEGGNGYLAPLAHNDGEQSTILPAGGTVPTCTEAGCKEYYQCSLCKDFFEDPDGVTPIEDLDAWKAEGGDGYLAPLGHDTKPVAGLEPTCTEDGYKEACQCQRCDLFLTTEGEVIGKGADYEAWTKDAEGGLIPALGHDIKLAEKKLDPTCTEAGHLAYYQCETCKLYFFKTDDLSKGKLVPEEERLQLDSKAEYTLIGDKAALNKWLAEGGDGYLAPLGHDMGEWEDSEDGKTHTRACQREGCKYTEKEEHIYKDGVCEICGAKEAKPAPAPKKPPKTGDESNAALWAALVLGLGSGATAVVLKKKHN